MSAHDELTTTFLAAAHALSPAAKAQFLLERALVLIDQGRYGPEVEQYLAVYLRTPDLPKESVAKALLARGNARKAGGQTLIAKAQSDFQAVLTIDPANVELQNHIRRSAVIRFADAPALQRIPPEIWDRIAHYIPRYFLRTWLFVSPFHREIALRVIFRTVDVYFGDDQDNVNRGLDIFDRAKADPVFASKVKSLRLHWAYEDGDMLDLMTRIFRTALPEFKHLEELEWIGYPECTQAMVESILKTHSRIHGLALIGWHFDAIGASNFTNLRKFTLRAEDDDGFADMHELRTILDRNSPTLTHLILGAYLARPHSYDAAFRSPTILNLTKLDVVDTLITHEVLTRVVAQARNLQEVTLHGRFEDPASAAVVFGADHVIDGAHTFLPLLESFRCILVAGEVVVEEEEDVARIWVNLVGFLKGRSGLRRLDLGSCPWEVVKQVLPGLTGLRVFGVRIEDLDDAKMGELINAIPNSVVAIHLGTAKCDQPLETYAHFFTRFHSLSFLHLRCASSHRPMPTKLSEKAFLTQSAIWLSSARTIAILLPSVDFLGWNGEHYVVVRPSCKQGSGGGGDGGDAEVKAEVELKELPARRRLDIGKGVDLGSDDAAWLERKDVPMDYELPSDAAAALL